MMRDVLGIVLAGGRGTRLEPLTRDRAKPAVPFGGIYRIIDFTLSNCINSDIRKDPGADPVQGRQLEPSHRPGLAVSVLASWASTSTSFRPSSGSASNWYQGTADAIYQNIYYDRKGRASRYPDPGRRPHLQDELRGDGRVPPRQPGRPDDRLPAGAATGDSRHFGVMEIDDADRVSAFLEKPADPPSMPGHPDQGLASMGIYVFTTDLMFELLFQDAARRGVAHDFGKDIIPDDARGLPGVRLPVPGREPQGGRLLARRGHARRLLPGQHGPDLGRPDPEPVRRRLADPDLSAAACRRPSSCHSARRAARGLALDSIVCSGRDRLRRPGASQHSLAQRADQQLRRWSRIRSCSRASSVGRHARVRRAIIDKDVHVPAGFTIGYDPELDRARGFTISEEGITVVAKDEDLERFSHPEV